MDRALLPHYYQLNCGKSPDEEGSARRSLPQSQQQAPERMSSTMQQPQPAQPLSTPTMPPTAMDGMLHSRLRLCGEVEDRKFVRSGSGSRSGSRTATYSDRNHPEYMQFYGDASARRNEFPYAALSNVVYNMPPQRPLKADNSAPNPIDQQALAPPMPGSFKDSPRPPPPASWWEMKPKDEAPMSNQAVKLPKPAPKEPVKETLPPASGMIAPNYYLQPPGIRATMTIKGDGGVGCLDCKRDFSSRVRYDDHHMLGGCMPDLSSAKAKAGEWIFRPRKITCDTFGQRRDADWSAKMTMGGVASSPQPTETLPAHKPKPVKTFSAEEADIFEGVWQPMFETDKEADRKAVEEGAKMWAKPVKHISDAVNASLSKAADEKKELHKQIQHAMGEEKESTESSASKDELKALTKAQELKKTTEPLQKKLNEFLRTERDSSPEESDQAHALKVLNGIINKAVNSPASKEEPNTPTKPLERGFEATKINTSIWTDKMQEKTQEQIQKYQEQLMQMGLQQDQQRARNQQLMAAYQQMTSQQHGPEPAVTETETDRAEEAQKQTQGEMKRTKTEMPATEVKNLDILPPKQSARKPLVLRPSTIYPSGTAPVTNKVKKSTSGWVSVSMPKSSTAPEKVVVRRNTKGGKRVLEREGKLARLTKLTEQEEKDLAGGFENLSLKSEGEKGWEKVEGELGEWELL